MSRLVWFIIGGYSALEAFSILPLAGGFSNILIRFIINPIAFLATSLFLILSFLILSQALNNFIIALTQSFKDKNHWMFFYIIELLLYIIGWGYLYSQNSWGTSLLFILTMSHLISSYEKPKDRSGKGGT